ncbi:hypothetical protein [Micromonospora chalcea]|uniref:hypothetical protein n=1 Tax=Micromonospora chalcea TaxID=1874 RepID=UPI003F4A3F84
MLAAEPPKVTDWMQAWGSLLGVGISTLAVIITGLLLRHEMRARRDEKEDSDAAQARLVATGLREPEVGSDGHMQAITLALRNYSSAPLYELYLELRDSRGDSRKTFTGGGMGGTGKAVLYQRYVQPNGKVDERHVFAKSSTIERADLLMFGEVYIRFIDAAGLAWSKRGTSAPVRLRAKWERRQRHEFWTWLWLYLWPFPATSFAVRRLESATRSKARHAAEAMMRHMQQTVATRAEKRSKR